MTDNFEAFKATIKAHGGHDAPWVVIAGRDAEEFDNNLRAIGDHSFEWIAYLAQAFGNIYLQEVRKDEPERPRRSYDDDRPRLSANSSRGSYGNRGGTGRSSSSRGGYRDDQPPEEHPEGLECRECGAVLVRKEGTSSRGYRYSGWVCPNGRRQGDGHDAIWD